MNNKEYLNNVFEKIASYINITDEMFDSAEAEYKKIGMWIEKSTPQYKIEIYPQGSFALGTIIKPYTREDEYDVDLVCEYQKKYGFTATELKNKQVRSILDKYGRATDIKEKRRCWQVTYEHNKKFHLDVIPAVKCNDFIQITNHDEKYDTYSYIGSNPKEYIKWFQSKQKKQYDSIKIKKISASSDDINPIKEYTIKTPLQKAIQILKRHRDVVFADDENKIKPISIIITTLAAELYQNENNIYDTLVNFFDNAETYITDHKNGTLYYIENPTYTGGKRENFADKWNEHPERAKAFFQWLKSAKHDLIDSLSESQSESEICGLIEACLGKTVSQSVFKDKPAVLKANETFQSETAVASYHEILILKAPHRQKPTFSCPKGYKVHIKAEVTTQNDYTFVYHNDSAAIPKHSSIKFTAIFSGVRPNYEVKWQIVNTGYEAQCANGLRGNFESTGSKTSKTENTLYTGTHSIQCFIFQKGHCVAVSKIFIVNIQ